MFRTRHEGEVKGAIHESGNESNEALKNEKFLFPITAEKSQNFSSAFGESGL